MSSSGYSAPSSAETFSITIDSGTATQVSIAANATRDQAIAAIQSTIDNNSGGSGNNEFNAVTVEEVGTDEFKIISAEKSLQISGVAESSSLGLSNTTVNASVQGDLVLTRAEDADTVEELSKGGFTFVESGTTNAASGFVCSNVSTFIVVGTGSNAGILTTEQIEFVQFSGAGSFTAGTGISISGAGQISVLANQTHLANLTASGGAISLTSASTGSMDNVAIGGTTPAAGTFSALTSSGGAVSLTSTGVVGTMNNVNIGGTTAGTGSFTDLTASNGTLTLTSTNAVGTMNNVNIGGTTAGSGTFTSLTSSGGQVQLTSNSAGSMDNVVIGSSTPAAGTFTSVTCTSDITLKTNVQTIEGQTGLDKLNRITPISWNWKEGADTKSTRMGVSAQQLAKIITDTVVENANCQLSVNYTDLLGLIISSVQELSRKINEQ